MSVVETINDYGNLVQQLQSTEEYKRNGAIAEAIQFLLNQISSLQTEKQNLINSNNETSQNNNNLNAIITQLKSENTLMQNENKLYKTKLSVTEQLNKTLEQTINELNTKISSQQKGFNVKCDQFNSILSEYKGIFEELKIEKLSLETQLSKSIKELNELKSKNEKLSKQLENFKTEQKKCEIFLCELHSYSTTSLAPDMFDWYSGA